jgi:hypothetical protein
VTPGRARRHSEIEAEDDPPALRDYG